MNYSELTPYELGKTGYIEAIKYLIVDCQGNVDRFEFTQIYLHSF